MRQGRFGPDNLAEAETQVGGDLGAGSLIGQLLDAAARALQASQEFLSFGLLMGANG